MAIITLLTDFGYEDTYVGTMKGVILGIAPDVRLIDLCHQIPPQDIEEGAWLLGTSYHYFPKGTIHLAVVDPGVGTSRHAIAIHAGGHYFVGPDNGLFSDIIARESSYQAIKLTRSQFFLPNLSNTFHGRDLFAPIAAHLARGVSLSELGEPIHELVQIRHSEPDEIPGAIRARVVRVDRFGNLITNLTRERWLEWKAGQPGNIVTIDIGRRQIEGISNTYSEAAVGGLLALFGSSGRLEIAMNNGSAYDYLKLGKETPVLISVLTTFIDRM